MADAIITPDDDGQAIPSALAAQPAYKGRSKVGKSVRPVAAFQPVETVRPAAPVKGVEVERTPDPVAAVVATINPPAPPSATPEPVVAPVPIPTAASPASKKESIMATTIENMTAGTDKAQAFFTDASERAKGAVAKSSKMFEEAGAFGKGNVEALVESSKIAAKGFETLSQEAAEYGRKSFEDATAAFKTLASVKSPTEFMKLQSDFVRGAFDAMVAETSRSTETMLKLAGEVAQPISNRIAVAAEKMKTSA